MKTYKLKIEIDKERVDGERHIIHETAIGERELADTIELIFARGLQVKLLPRSCVWYPAHRIKEIFVEEEKNESTA